MKNFTKKLFSLVLCVALLFTTASVFVGCGGDEGTEEDEIVLSIGYDNGGYGITWLNNAVKKFCTANNLSVDSIQIEAQKGITDVLNDRFSSDVKIRDIFISTGATSREWASKGYLEPVDDVLNTKLSTGKTVKESLIDQSYLEVGYYKEHYYSMPSDDGAWGIYYNKTLFDQYGWQVPETVTDLMTLCQTILDADVGVTPFGCSSDINNYWDFIVMNWIVQIIGEDGFKTFCKMESKELYNPTSVYAQAKLTALNAWENLISSNNGRYVKKDSSNFEAIQALFAQGKIAMMPNGNWFEHEIIDALEGTNYEIAIMQTPAIEGAKVDGTGKVIKVNYSSAGGGWIIPAKAKHKDLAKKFLAFMAEPEQLRDYMVDCGGKLPYECDYSSILDKLTYCQKSVYDTVNNSYNAKFISSNPITYASARIGFWVQGEPYASILNGKTSQQIIDEEYSYLTDEWDNLVRLANI